MKKVFRTILTEMAKKAAPDDAAHLRRWAKHPDAAVLYAKISGGKFGAATESISLGAAIEFIKGILALRRAHEALPPHPLLDKKTKKRFIQLCIKALEGPQITAKELPAYRREIRRAVDKRLPYSHPVLQVREGPTANKVRFCRGLSLYRATGRWHDAEVAALCEIACDCGDVTIDMVRAARKGLHT